MTHKEAMAVLAKQLTVNKPSGAKLMDAIWVLVEEETKRLELLRKPTTHRPGLLCPVHDGLPGNRASGVKCNGASRRCSINEWNPVGPEKD